MLKLQRFEEFVVKSFVNIHQGTKNMTVSMDQYKSTILILSPITIYSQAWQLFVRYNRGSFHCISIFSHLLGEKEKKVNIFNLVKKNFLS